MNAIQPFVEGLVSAGGLSVISLVGLSVLMMCTSLIDTTQPADLE